MSNPWEMRIGVASGTTIIGLVGNKRQSYTAMGDVVNISARLQKVCTPGRVLIDRFTYETVSRFIDDDESYFVHELVGLQVVTDRGEPVGELVEVLTTGSADVYVARGPRGEVLFPAISDVVREIDLANGLMVITPMADTLDDSQ